MMSFHEMTDGDLAHYLRVGCAELHRRRARLDPKAKGKLKVGDYEINALTDEAGVGEEPLSEEAKARRKREEEEGLPPSDQARAQAAMAEQNRKQEELEVSKLRQAQQSDQTARDALQTENYETGSRAHKQQQREDEDAERAEKNKGKK